MSSPFHKTNVKFDMQKIQVKEVPIRTGLRLPWYRYRLEVVCSFGMRRQRLTVHSDGGQKGTARGGGDGHDSPRVEVTHLLWGL